MINTKNGNILQNLTDSIENFFLKIFNKIGLKTFVLWYVKHQEGMRYLIFGGISTIINIIVFMALDCFGVPTLTSNFIAWIISIIFGYVTNKMCVFYSITSSKKELLQEATSFLGCRVFTLIIDEMYMYITVDILSFNSLVMKIISNIIVIFLNFVFSKIWIFKK